MTIDERIEALTMSLELLTRDVETLRDTARQHTQALQIDADNIRRLATIAESHERRLTDLEES